MRLKSITPKHLRGLSLIELVIALSISGILGVVAVSMLRGGFGVATAANETNELSYTSRYVVERIAKETRHASYNIAGNYNISIMTASQLKFTNIDGNDITITIAAPNITMNYLNPTSGGVLSNLVTSASFKYYQGDGVTISASNANVKFIELTLILQKDGITYDTRTRIALRDGAA